MIQFDDGREVFQFFYFSGFWHGFKVIYQAFVRVGAVGGGQALVGVAAHDGVQVVFVGGFVPVQQAAVFQGF